jgi:RNA recognition motif-containing protein
MRIHVSNIPFTCTPDQLHTTFVQFGRVAKISIPRHEDTGRPIGYALVEMIEEDDGLRAIRALDETSFLGRVIRVKESWEKRGRDGRFGDRGGYWR